MINRGKNLTTSNLTQSVKSVTLTRKFDVDYYNQTGELKYLDEGEETVVVDSTLNTKKLREDITTIEQFNALGNTTKVAKLYGVSEGTVHGHKIHLQAQAKAEGRVYDSGVCLTQSKINTAKMHDEVKTVAEFEAIGSCSKVAHKYDVSKTAANAWMRKLKEKEGEDKPVISHEKATDALSDEQIKSEGDCAKESLTSPESVGCETEDLTPEQHAKIDEYFRNEQTVDDLQGLAEPEPVWGGGATAWDFSDKALDRIIEEIKKPETDEEIWNLIFDCVSDLRDRGIKKVDADIQSRLRDMVGGMR